MFLTPITLTQWAKALCLVAKPKLVILSLVLKSTLQTLVTTAVISGHINQAALVSKTLGTLVNMHSRLKQAVLLTLNMTTSLLHSKKVTQVLMTMVSG